MKSEITIFTGSGASKVYGFPTGEGLLKQIVADLESQPERGVAWHLVSEIGIGSEQLEEFRRSLRRSRVTSIDQFHSTRKDLMQIGKMIVTAHIIGCEDPDKLLPDKPDWLRILLNRVLEDCQSLDQARNKLASIRFITLNYDRSIEQIIRETLSSRYVVHNWSDAHEEQFLDWVHSRVHHLHGSVGRLQNQVDKRGRPYETRIPSKTTFIKISEQIVFLDEKSSSCSAWSDLNMELNGAEKVAFLGFGFHNKVTSRFAPEVLSGKPLFTTLRGVTDELRKSVLTLLVPNEAVFSPPKSCDSIGKLRIAKSEDACEEIIEHLLGLN